MSAVVNMGVQRSVLLILLGLCPDMTLLYYMVIQFSFLRHPILFFLEVAPFYVPTINAQGFQFLYRNDSLWDQNRGKECDKSLDKWIERLQSFFLKYDLVSKTSRKGLEVIVSLLLSWYFGQIENFGGSFSLCLGREKQDKVRGTLILNLLLRPFNFL
jgi:hypothetical protein